MAIEKQKKYIIQFGGDKNTAYCRANAQQMERQAYFHGTIIDVSLTHPIFGRINSINSIASGHSLTWDLFSVPLDDLKNAQFKRLTQNLIRSNIAAAQGVGIPTIDITDEKHKASYLNNIKMFARFARESRCRGVLFDNEAYNQSTFWAPGLGKTEASFNQLGAETMRALVDEYPSALIVIAISYEQVEFHPANLKYNFLPAFLDGFHDAAPSGVKIVNFGEEAYANKTLADMDYDIRYQLKKNLTFCKSQNYDQVHEHGLATFLDYPGTNFNYLDDTLNYNSIDQFSRNLFMMLERAPRYVFVYTQQPKWYSGVVGVDSMPEGYRKALKKISRYIHSPLVKYCKGPINLRII